MDSQVPDRRQAKGFSLIELMVVVSIIAILMALGSVSFRTAQRKARDAKRKGDIKAVQEAFEQYFAKNGAYGTVDQMSTAEYLPGGLPTDPRPAPWNQYQIEVDTVNQIFCACAQLETDEGNSNSWPDTLGQCDYSNNDGINLFCLQNQQ